MAVAAPTRGETAVLNIEAHGGSQMVWQHSAKLHFLEVMKSNENKRGLFSVISTLTMGIMGGAVLPIAWAFSVTGVFVGVLIMVVVSAANAYTSDLLLRQSYKTGALTFETLAHKIGGRWWKLVTDVSIVILMLGTVVGAIQQAGEAGSIGLLSIEPNTPGWLVNAGGRFIMAVGTVFIIAPLSMVKQMRQLEYVGVIGACTVIWLVTTVVIDCSQHNFPALRSHDFDRWGFSSIGNIAQAVSIFGFAFYIQPIMMSLLQELPPGKVGAKVLEWGNRVVVLVNSFLVYIIIGFFGAAKYGQNSEDNILSNQWLGGGVAQGILNLSMSSYLFISTPFAVFPLWICMDEWIPGDKERHRRKRQILITSFWLLLALGIAEAFPSTSGKVLTATGATGVCLVSYFIPIINHLTLFFAKAQCQREALGTKEVFFAEQESSVPDHKHLLPEPLAYRSRVASGPVPWICEMLGQVVAPVLVLSVGIFCSIAALWTIGQD